MPAGPVRTLVAAQLKLDLRHPRTGRPGGASRMALTVLAYGFSGLVLALSLGDAKPEPVLFVAGSFGLVLAAFGITGSYDELMGRPRENAWLATLPASEGAQYTARLVGIALYVLLMAVAVAVPVGVRLGLAHGAGPAAQVAALMTGMMVWTAAAVVAALWALTLALPYRLLKPVLGAVRTLLIGLLVLGYQWIGSQDGAGADAPWWPAAWLADGLSGRTTLGLAALIGSTGVLVGAFAAAFPPRYFRLLRRLADGAQLADRTARPRRPLSALERLITPSPAARAAYGFAVAAFKDDRLVSGRLWPAALLPLGFGLFGWWMGGLGDLFAYGPGNVLTEPDLQLHLSLLVILLFAAQSLVQTLQFSDHAEAAWAFETLPLASPRVLQLGAQQALVLRVLLPLHVLLALTLWTRMPLGHAALHAAFWFAVTALFTRGQALLYRHPPFARRGDRFNAAERFAPLLVAIPGALAVLAIQTFTFTTPLLAAAATAGLLTLSAGLGQVALALRPRPRRLALARPAPAPEAA